MSNDGKEEMRNEGKLRKLSIRLQGGEEEKKGVEQNKTHQKKEQYRKAGGGTKSLEKRFTT